MDGLDVPLGIVFLIICGVVQRLRGNDDLVLVVVVAIDPVEVSGSARGEDDGGWGVGVRGGRGISVGRGSHLLGGEFVTRNRWGGMGRCLF